MKVLGRKLFRPGRAVSASRVISAPAADIFDLLADPSMHPAIDGSGTVKSTRGRAVERLEMGTTFGMDMEMGASYKILNEVVEFEEGRRIAWRHFHGHIWRYELEHAGDETTVTETFDYGPARFSLGLEIAGFPERNLKGMVKTLERLDELVAGQRA